MFLHILRCNLSHAPYQHPKLMANCEAQCRYRRGQHTLQDMNLAALWKIHGDELAMNLTRTRPEQEISKIVQATISSHTPRLSRLSRLIRLTSQLDKLAGCVDAQTFHACGVEGRLAETHDPTASGELDLIGRGPSQMLSERLMIGLRCTAKPRIRSTY